MSSTIYQQPILFLFRIQALKLAHKFGDSPAASVCPGGKSKKVSDQVLLDEA